jgi:ribosome biogenesis GTPase A
MKVAQTFRKTFSLPDNDLLRWFPGHMNKAMNQMQSRFKDTDCIIEIHDARIPISGRNPRFNDIIALRPHILLLNKFDFGRH